MRRKAFVLFVLFIAALLAVVGCTQPAAQNAVAQQTIAQSSHSPAVSRDLVLMETTAGNITIALDPEMPVTAGNFESLVRKGFYNGVIFHRVIPGFVIQGGDPTGTGTGGPGYTIRDEFTSHNHNVRGSVAMANAGPDTGGSQFFINLADNSGRPGFDSNYPVFGSVIQGMDVVDAIARGKTTGPPNDRPLEPVTIIRADVL